MIGREETLGRADRKVLNAVSVERNDRRGWDHASDAHFPVLNAVSVERNDRFEGLPRGFCGARAQRCQRREK